MNTEKYLSQPWVTVFANDNDAYIPEIWAAESLMILQNNMVTSNLVHRDFSNEIAAFGDVVNTRKPADFTANRKSDTENVVVQDAVSPNVGVRLDQHVHTSFEIADGEESKGFKNLVDVYLEPALISIAQIVDEIVLGMVYQFLDNTAGSLGAGASKSGILAARKTMNDNKVPVNGRNMVITSSSEADLLNIDNFVSADKVGDEGTALREGSLGRKFGFEIFMDQNTPSITTGNSVITNGLINNAAGYPTGTTVVTVDGFSAALINGSWFVIAGDLTPHRIISTVGGATPTAITFSPGLRSGVADNDSFTVYTPGAVDNGGGYASGTTPSAGITVDGFSISPQTGQLISFAIADPVYSALTAPTTTRVDVNRALQLAIADDEVVGIGPAGDYNFFFHRNALSLVNRPLATPTAGSGARAAVANFNDLSIRVVMTYNGLSQATLVTVDLLLGTEVLDVSLGGVMLA